MEDNQDIKESGSCSTKRGNSSLSIVLNPDTDWNKETTTEECTPRRQMEVIKKTNEFEETDMTEDDESMGSDIEQDPQTDEKKEDHTISNSFTNFDKDEVSVQNSSSEVKDEAIEIDETKNNSHSEDLESDGDSRNATSQKVRCNQCSKVIAVRTLKNHIANVHSEEKTNFICNDCGKGFKFESGLSLHRMKHHGAPLPKAARLPKQNTLAINKTKAASDIESSLTCEICGKKFRHITSLTVHLQKHELGRVLECSICDKSFFTEPAHNAHQQMHQSLLPSQCYICKKMCRRPGLFREHIKKHKSEAQYQCDKCPKVFLEATDLAVHLMTHIQRVFYMCSICNQRFPSQAEKNVHDTSHAMDARRRTEKNEKIYTRYAGSRLEKNSDTMDPKKEVGQVSCEICLTSFSSKNLLKGHVNKVHLGKKGHPCNICGVEFHKLKHLQAHHWDHAVKKVIPCKVCGENFDLRSRLRKHMEIHASVIIYKCVVCSKQFTNLDNLNQHAGGHKDDVLDCCVCGQQLADSRDIMEHVKKHKDCRTTVAEEEKSKMKASQFEEEDEKKTPGTEEVTEDRVQVKCTVCEKTFHFVSSLQSHMRIHQKDQMLNCHICGEAWSGVKALREHIRTHKKDQAEDTGQSSEQTTGKDKVEEGVKTGEKRKRHRCDICLERFVSYYSCKTHRLLHTGEKPFRCDVCGQGYVLAGSLKVHMLSHTKDKPHVCEICGKSFKQPYILREHQMSHTGKKPFLCDLCGKSFVNRKKLKLHNFVHTRETPFNCKVCGRGFRAFVTRQKHKCEGPPDSSRKEETDSGIVLDSLQVNDRRQLHQVQPPQDFPSSQTAYEDFAYLPVSRADYSLGNQSYKQDQGHHMFRQGPCQPLHKAIGTPMGPVMSREDYMAPAPRYVDPREALPPNHHPPPIAWQQPPCNQELPDDLGRNLGNQHCMTTVNRMDISWNKIV